MVPAAQPSPAAVPPGLSQPPALPDDLKAFTLLNSKAILRDELQACVDARAWERAIDLLAGPKSDPELLEREICVKAIQKFKPTTLVKKLEAGQKFSQHAFALGLLKAMRQRKVEPDMTIARAAIKACATWSGVQGVLDHLEAASPGGVDGDTLELALRSCSRIGDWEAATGLLERLRRTGADLGVDTYNNALRSFRAAGSRGHWERAVTLLDDMQAEGFSPDETTYRQLLRVAGLETSAAIRLLGNMRARGLNQDLETWTAVLRSCARGDKEQQWQQALSVLAEMRTQEAVKPNMEIFRITMLACIEGEQWDWVRMLWHDMAEAGVQLDEISCQVLLPAFAAALRWDWVLAMCGEALDAGINPYASFWQWASLACGETGRWELALWLTNPGNPHVKISGNVHSALAAALDKHDLQDRLLQLFRQGLEEGWVEEPTDKVDLHCTPTELVPAAIMHAVATLPLTEVREGLPGLPVVFGRGKRSKDGVAQNKNKALDFLSSMGIGEKKMYNRGGAVRLSRADVSHLRTQAARFGITLEMP